MFQFQNGAIKRLLGIDEAINQLRFNSKMVRLKAIAEFDSKGNDEKFQFQNGAIKS